MIPQFDPQTQMRELLAVQDITRTLSGLSIALRRHYYVNEPPKIGFFSVRKRIAAFKRMIEQVDHLRLEHDLEDEDAAILLLSCVLKNRRCRKAMEGFHFEWHYEGGHIDVPVWLCKLGY